MNTIELTDLHKSRLAEMCEILFPEYTIYGIQKANHFGRIVNIVQGNKWESDDDDQYPVDEFFIHWFEFCMTKLWIKINSLLNHKTPEELMSMYNAFWNISNEKLHPIDYLYEQFKQLK